MSFAIFKIKGVILINQIIKKQTKKQKKQKKKIMKKFQKYEKL